MGDSWTVDCASERRNINSYDYDGRDDENLLVWSFANKVLSKHKRACWDASPFAQTSQLKGKNKKQDEEGQKNLNGEVSAVLGTISTLVRPCVQVCPRFDCRDVPTFKPVTHCSEQSLLQKPACKRHQARKNITHCHWHRNSTLPILVWLKLWAWKEPRCKTQEGILNYI